MALLAESPLDPGTRAGIGVDFGGNGMAVVQELLTLDKYKPLGLEGRLNGSTSAG